MAVLTSNYPTSLDTTSTLGEVSNRAKTTLSVALANTGETQISLSDASSFPTTGAVTIDNEIFYYSNKSGNVLTIESRAAQGTVAAAHSSGATVYLRFTKGHWEVIRSSVISLETKLGTSSSTPTASTWLKGTGTGTSAWSTITKSDVGLSAVENTALSTWAGSTNLTTLGTIGTGTWQGSIIGSTYGGTGVNNAGRTLTINTNSGTISFTNPTTTLTVANTGSISGTNTGDQTITLTGDVTGSGTGSFAASIGSNKVTLGMLATLAANSVIGNSTGSTATPTAVSMLATASASSVLLRDANANAVANSFLSNYATTATAAGTTTLTVSSAYFQYFTGTLTQTVQLPVATTLANGQSWYIVNKSSGAVTIQTSGANTLVILAGGTSALVTCINTAGGTGTASWDYYYYGASITSAKKLSVSNTMTFSAADDTGVYTFPTGTKTLVATDVTTLSSLATVGTIGSGTWQGGVIGSTYGGTGVNNAGRTLTISTNSGTISFTSSVTLTVANTASVSGTNTGDQTITLTSDVTGSGTGSFATTIAAGAVTLGKMANLAANSVIGNTTGSPATPAAVSMVTTASANSVLLRDSNANATATNFLASYATTATAGGTTTLTVSSAYFQFFTGTLAQTLQLPVASTLANGQSWVVENNSTGAVTVQTSGLNTLLILAAGTRALITCINTAGGTGTASWDFIYYGDVVASGKKLNVSNSLTLAGTDGTTMTFPSTSATIARTDAANTFTGTQTFNTPIAASSVATMTNTVGGGVPTPPNNTTTFLRGDGTFATPTGGGTVTNTGGNLTLNAVVLGAGTVDTKVSTGITSNGTAQLILGVNATTIGTLKMFGNTSGDVTLQPTAAAGTATTQTLPATSGTLVNRVTTANGVSASNSDGALTISLGAITPTTVNGNTFTTGTYTLTGGAGKTLTFNNSITLAGTDSTTMTFPAASTTVAGLGTTQTFTGINTFTPTARSSGVASYLTITMPSDTGQTASTESIGVNFTAGTRTWADGTTTLQREHVFGAPTYNRTTTSATFTTAVNVDIANPIAGAGVTITNNYSLRAADVLFTGIIKAGSSPITLTNATGNILGAALVGTDITTVGTIGSGTWQGGVIGSTYGGTGVNNGGRTLTINTNSGTISFTSAVTLTVANTASVSGTNTGDQTITLTGDVTGSGTGSFATTIGANKVTLGMQATLAANSVIGNSTGSTATPTAVSMVTTATANAVALRDSNANLTAVNMLSSYTTTATAAGTTTLTVSSNYYQFFTGSTTQTVTLPVATTLVNGQSWYIVNLSTGAVTIQTSGSFTLLILAAGTKAIVTCKDTAGGTGTASWDYVFYGFNITSSKKLSVSHTMTLSAPDDTGQYTFPSGTKTLVATDVATLSSLTSVGTIGTGTWQAGVIGSTYGGTGVNNAGRTLTINTNSGTLAFGAASKTLTINNSITLAGTDSTTMTFPTTSATIARTDAANTFTGVQTFNTPIAASSLATMTATVGGAVPTPPNNTTTFLRGDGTFAAPTGGGTVTNTGGALTANSVVLGAGSADTKVVAGITSNGIGQLVLGVNATTLGTVKMFGNTSGDVTLQPTAAAGTATTQTLPATSGTLVNRVTTANGVSASNSDGALTISLGSITPSLITIASNSQALTLGTSGDVTVYGNSLDASNTETWIYGTKANHALLLRSANTTFRILAYSTSGYGYFQAGVTGGSNSGSLYFSGYNGATATQVQFISTDSWATGNLGVGHSGTNSAKLHVISTTEQFRAGYSTTNYWSAVTDSGSVTTFTATGTSPTFRFATPIQFNDGSSGSTWLPWTDGNIYLSSANIIFRNAGGTEQGRLDSSGLNLRPKARVTSTSSSSTPTPNCDNEEIYILTALAVGATFGAVGGTPTNGQRLLIRIKDNGTARTLGWNAVYRAMGVALPTTTVISKTMYIGFIYNSTDSKWDCVSVAQEA